MTVEDLRVLPEAHVAHDPSSATCSQLQAESRCGRRESEGIRRGIAPVLDRFIRQVLLEVVRPLLDPTFSDTRYGFRPRRSALDAVRRGSRAHPKR